MTSIATLTLNPAIDKSCRVEQVVPERKLRCREPQFDPGGGGINVARAVTELGGDVLALWMCGGPTGEMLKKLLDESSVPHEPIPIEASTRENLIVFEESSGQQFRFGMPGGTLNEADVQNCRERLKSLDPPPKFLVLSGSLPANVDEDLYARLIRDVPDSCRVILDTSGPPLKLGIEVPVYLIKPNIRELGELMDTTIEDDVQIRAAARALIAAGKTQVVVTSLGSGGVALTTEDEHAHIRAPTVKIESKVGAGDSMVAGIVLGLSQGQPIEEAVRLGVAAGSAAVMTKGTELCRREDVERLAREMKHLS